MKKLLVGLFMMFVCVASATTINLSWMVDNNTYAQTTCESGGNLNIPSTNPTKRGYHFIGWDFYTRLEYIESTGTQWIDTGFSPDSNTRVDWKVSFTRYEYLVPLFGARVSGANSGRFFPIACGSIDGNGRTTFGERDALFQISTSTIYTGSFRPAEGISIINDTTYDISNAEFEKIQENNIYLFATSGYTTQLYESYGKIWYIKIYDNGTLVRDFVPAKRNSDNVLGMYDTVSGQFFTNQGTGEFIAGPVSANQTLE